MIKETFEEEKEPTLGELGEKLEEQEKQIKDLQRRMEIIEKGEGTRLVDPSGVLLTKEETKKIREEGQSLH